MSWISGVYEYIFIHDPYLKWSESTWRHNLYGLCKQPAVGGRSVAAETNKK